MANLRGIISQLSGARRGGAGGTAGTRRRTTGTGTGMGTGTGAAGGRGGADEAIGRGVRKFLRRAR